MVLIKLGSALAPFFLDSEGFLAFHVCDLGVFFSQEILLELLRCRCIDF
jgi:hypothetical protein